MKIAVCFLSIIKDHFNLQNLKNQANNSKYHQIDIYEYLDYDSEYKNENNTIYFNYPELKRKFNYLYEYDWKPGLGKKEGMMFLPFLDMWLKHKNEYDFYLFIEDDVSYFGNKNLFDTINFDCHALMIFHPYMFTKYMQNHWWLVQAPHYLDPNIIKDNCHRYCNIFGMQSNIVSQLVDFIDEGNYAFFEWMIPSFLFNIPIKINYISSYLRVFDTFDETHLPKQLFYEMIHPIKNIETYNYYKNNFIPIN